MFCEKMSELVCFTRMGKGGWVWKPILWTNQEDFNSVVKRIGFPTRNTCLRCHAGPQEMYGVANVRYPWVEATRFMSILLCPKKNRLPVLTVTDRRGD